MNQSLQIKNYLKPSKLNINSEEVELIFKIQCRVKEVKMNLKGKYENQECDFYKKK